MTKIILADDHALLRESVASLLRQVPDFNIIGLCENGRCLLSEVKRLHPNVVVLDTSLADLNGADATRRIHQISPATRVVVLSLRAEETYIRDMLNAGIVGYVLKSGAAADLSAAIRNGSKRKVYFSREIRNVGRRIQYHSNSIECRKALSPAAKPLTGREREVLRLIGEGCTTTKIADELNISAHTVKTHRNQLMDKLDIRDVAGLTRKSVSLKLVYPD